MLLERVESFLEDAVDGFFGLVLRAKIQPLEIARRLTREAEEQKIITLNRVYIPNRFQVDLHPADLDSLKAIGPEWWYSQHLAESYLTTSWTAGWRTIT